MSKTKMEKTNAMRILDKAKVRYLCHYYEHGDGAIDGISVAEKLCQPVSQVFKTLVTKGNGPNYFVFVIPVAEELDLKAAARAAGQKSVQLIPVKEINAVTGYIRGGCSPIGMKKPYPVVIDESVLMQSTVMISGGKIGCQVEIAPTDLIHLTNAKTATLTMPSTGGSYS